MHRTTIYLEPDLELRLKAAARREGRPVAELIREAIRERLDRVPPSRSPHAGAFASGHRDTADNVDEILASTGFGE
ncbi:MAG: CopG family transcriptional regulator [Sporichthyaceae bacterium]